MTTLRATILRALLALGLSFSLWAFVSFSQNPEELVPFEGLTPQVVGLQPDLVIVDANGLPNPTMPSVDIALRTDRNQRTELRPVDIRTVVDLSGFGAGEHIVPINVQATRSTISFTLPTDGVSPSAIPIRLEQVMSNTIPIDLKVMGNLPFSFERGEPQITSGGESVSTVQVSGPQNRVQRVSAVQTTANIEQLRASYQAPLSLTAVDSNGQPVEGVTVNPPTINIRIPITSVVGLKLVPVQAAINGLPDPGYMIMSVQVDPPLIALTGSSGPLDAAAVLQTKPIDISGARGSLVRQGQLIFPEGTSPQIGEPTSVEVTILIAQVSQTFQVSLPAAVRVSGLESGLIASLNPDLVSLTMSGKNDLLDQLAKQTLIATVDVSGLGPGNYELSVSVRLPEGVTLVTPAPQVTVSLRTATLAPTETLSSTPQPTTEGPSTPTATGVATTPTASASPSQPGTSETTTREASP